MTCVSFTDRDQKHADTHTAGREWGGELRERGKRAGIVIVTSAFLFAIAKIWRCKVEVKQLKKHRHRPKRTHTHDFSLPVDGRTTIEGVNGSDALDGRQKSFQCIARAVRVLTEQPINALSTCGPTLYEYVSASKFHSACAIAE